ncbi:hypothetical protein JCM19233_379 [Vibrio astriarenae]|nr:hypothetical protein JCM19233_379 [Vibrio sp. C7]
MLCDVPASKLKSPVVSAKQKDGTDTDAINMVVNRWPVFI